jgi:hypothetical protein
MDGLSDSISLLQLKRQFQVAALFNNSTSKKQIEADAIYTAKVNFSLEQILVDFGF